MTAPEEHTDSDKPEEDQPVSTPEPETPAIEDEVVVEIVEPDLDTDVEIEGLDAVAPIPAVFSDRPIQTVGRRKEAIVRVRLMPGTGRKIATTVYGAEGIELPPLRASRSPGSRSRASRTCRSAWRRPTSRCRTTRQLRNRPEGFVVPIRDIRVGKISAPGMLVPLCGDMLQMPGFVVYSAAFAIDIDENGETVGLF